MLNACVRCDHELRQKRQKQKKFLPTTSGHFLSLSAHFPSHDKDVTVDGKSFSRGKNFKAFFFKLTSDFARMETINCIRKFLSAYNSFHMELYLFCLPGPFSFQFKLFSWQAVNSVRIEPFTVFSSVKSHSQNHSKSCLIYSYEPCHQLTSYANAMGLS